MERDVKIISDLNYLDSCRVLGRSPFAAEVVLAGGGRGPGVSTTATAAPAFRAGTSSVYVVVAFRSSRSATEHRAQFEHPSLPVAVSSLMSVVRGTGSIECGVKRCLLEALDAIEAMYRREVDSLRSLLSNQVVATKCLACGVDSRRFGHFDRVCHICGGETEGDLPIVYPSDEDLSVALRSYDFGA